MRGCDVRLAVHLPVIALGMCPTAARVAADEQVLQALVVFDSGFAPVERLTPPNITLRDAGLLHVRIQDTDVAPTVARLFGLTLTGAEGKVLSAALAD
jgi:hypothetical protein